MTSLAFTMGVVPLVLSSGRVRKLRQAIGVGGVFGMLGVTFLRIVADAGVLRGGAAAGERQGSETIRQAEAWQPEKRRRNPCGENHCATRNRRASRVARAGRTTRRFPKQLTSQLGDRSLGSCTAERQYALLNHWNSKLTILLSKARSLDERPALAQSTGPIYRRTQAGQISDHSRVRRAYHRHGKSVPGFINTPVTSRRTRQDLTLPGGGGRLPAVPAPGGAAERRIRPSIAIFATCR